MSFRSWYEIKEWEKFCENRMIKFIEGMKYLCFEEGVIVIVPNIPYSNFNQSSPQAIKCICNLLLQKKNVTHFYYGECLNGLV